MKTPGLRSLLLTLALGVSLPASGQEAATFSSASLTPASALKAAQAALKACQDAGFNVAVTVTDRSGNPLVMLRDRFAGAHTAPTASGKAWTAASFRTNTSDLIPATQPANASHGIRYLPGVVILGGGMMIESQGSLVGAIGISGAPTGADDDRCATAGIAAIQDSLAF